MTCALPIARRLLLPLLAVLLFSGGAGSSEEDLVLDIPAGLRAAGSDAGDVEFTEHFLPAHQSPDGSWSARDWGRWCNGFPQVEGALRGSASANHDLTVTSLALCAFLGAGYTHRGRHPQAKVVSRGIRWLRRRQGPDGACSLPGDADPRTAHAIATLALTENYGMTGSILTRGPSRKALAYLLAGQRPSGAWPLPRGTGADALATFWAGMALKSAELINKDAAKRQRPAPYTHEVTPALARAVAWFDARTDPSTGIVRATGAAEEARGGSTLVLTAAGALLRVFAGQDPGKDMPLRAACEYLGAHPPVWASAGAEGHGLYVYIGTLVTFQAGGKAWKRWKRGLDKAATDTQRRDTDACAYKGSWDPEGPWATARGRVAMTALMSMSLQVFYRYYRVFGSGRAARPNRPRLDVLRSQATWTRSSLPVHAARMTLAEGGSLPLDAVHVRADIHGVRAQVVLDLFVTNTQRGLREGVLDLRLPDGASPYYLAFGTAELAKVPRPGAQPAAFATDLASLHAQREGAWGMLREARMAPVESATEAFEEIVRKRRDPALLTWSGAGVYRLRVFPLERDTQHRIVVAYEVDLTLVEDAALLSVGLPAGVPDVHVAVRAEDRVRTWHNPQGTEIPVRVELPGDVWIRGSDAAGLMHTAAWVRPDAPAVERPSSGRAQILFDVSKSVLPEQMHVWRELVPALLARNRDRIRSFAVGFFDQRTRWFRKGYSTNTPANVAALREALEALEPGGATDLAQALRSLGAGAEQTDVFLFTDGKRTWGERAREQVLAALPPGRRVFVYDVGLGSSDRAMLTALAARSGGALIPVLGAADVVPAVRAHRYQSWELEGAEVAGLTDLLLAGGVTRVYPGQRLRLAARGEPAEGAALVLRLRRGENALVLRTPVTAAALSPMAARVYGIAGTSRLEEVAGVGVAETARAYAMHYRVVRRSCALVMLESEKQYEEFGLDTTGHAERVAARSVAEALRGAQVRRTASPGAPFSLESYARTRRVPEALLGVLAPRGRPVPRTPLPDDPVLRSLGSAFDDEPRGVDRMRLALHAHALGRHEHALHALLPEAGEQSVPWPAYDWLTARVAQAADRPQLALVAYEAALGDRRVAVHAETLWVIAADYERYLGRLSREGLPSGLARFVRARRASLKLWREYMRGHAPPTEAALVVVHQPLDLRDLRRIEIRTAHGVLTPDNEDGASSRGVWAFPRWPAGEGPQMTMVSELPRRGYVSVHLARPAEEPEAEVYRRSLVIVIRDWGLSSERVSLVRSLGPEQGRCLLRLRR